MGLPFPAQPRPVTPGALADLIADRVAGLALDHPVRVAVDGAPESSPAALADALVDPLRLRGRAAVRVRAADFLRPASVRFERGRTDPDALYELGIDTGGLLRELLVPLGPGGSGRYLPALWDAERDRASRAPYATATARTVAVVDGAFLLQPTLRWEWDLAVHLHLSPAALRRRTAPDGRWVLPAYERYDDEVGPVESADVVVLADDPRHPAVVSPG